MENQISKGVLVGNRTRTNRLLDKTNEGIKYGNDHHMHIAFINEHYRFHRIQLLSSINNNEGYEFKRALIKQMGNEHFPWVVQNLTSKWPTLTTKWFMPEAYHIYYCPYCGTYIAGNGYGKPPARNNG